MRNFSFLTFALLISAACTQATAATLTLTLDTSTLSGQTGSVDFQFNPANSSSPAATVQVLNFAGGTGSAQTTFGAASGGPLPAALTLNNTNADNEVFEAFTFGKTLSFNLAFSGPAVTSPTGGTTSSSEFFFSVFSDAAGNTPALTSNANGWAATVTIRNDGTLVSSAISPQASFVPEPGTIFLMLGGFAAAALGRKLRLAN